MFPAPFPPRRVLEGWLKGVPSDMQNTWGWLSGACASGDLPVRHPPPHHAAMSPLYAFSAFWVQTPRQTHTGQLDLEAPPYSIRNGRETLCLVQATIISLSWGAFADQCLENGFTKYGRFHIHNMSR